MNNIDKDSYSLTQLRLVKLRKVIGFPLLGGIISTDYGVAVMICNDGKLYNSEYTFNELRPSYITNKLMDTIYIDCSLPLSLCLPPWLYGDHFTDYQVDFLNDSASSIYDYYRENNTFTKRVVKRIFKSKTIK